LRKDFNDEEYKLHKRIITERDKEFAHSDREDGKWKMVNEAKSRVK